jgi:hypothetical protein
MRLPSVANAGASDGEGIVMPRRFAIATLLAVLAGSLLAVPAQGRNGRHCAYRLVTVSRHGSVNEARADLIGCYSTFAQSLAAGTGGSVHVSDSMTPQRLTDAELQTGTRAGLVAIGTEFNNNGYDGVSRSFFAESTCSATDIWEWNYVGDDWNDRSNSGKGFGGCDHNKKFEAADFGGNVLTCTPNCTNYGILANEVSSLRYRP